MKKPTAARGDVPQTAPPIPPPAVWCVPVVRLFVGGELVDEADPKPEHVAAVHQAQYRLREHTIRLLLRGRDIGFSP